MNTVISSVTEIPEHFFAGLGQKKTFSGVVMCPPDYFKIIDIKNSHMKNYVGCIDHKKAETQWQALKEAFESNGVKVHQLKATPDLEDMVFTANPACVGETLAGKPRLLLSNMRHASRKKEVPAFEAFFKTKGYDIAHLKSDQYLFEGHGDALWHTDKKLIFGGFGYRTEKAVYQQVGELFSCPVIVLELLQEDFYHLDTCLCILSEKSVLYYPPAFTAEGVDMIKACFKDAIDVDEKEAREGFACNAWCFKDTVFIQKNNSKTISALRSRNFKVVEVETSEFMKSGGSVFCMKMEVF